MTRRSLFAVPFAIGAWVAGATIALSPAAVAAPKPLPILAQTVTIYSDTFTPAMRMPDGQSMQNSRYFIGPGYPPNMLTVVGTSGTDAFFNTPDLAIGSTPMSVVSAEVCLRVYDGNSEDGANAMAVLMFGVQDKDRNFTLWLDPDPADPNNPNAKIVVPSDAQVCETMTFSQPVQLVNHPHIVLAVMFFGLGLDDAIDLDGVKYTLNPTQVGDLAPGEGMVGAVVPDWLGAR